MKLQISDHGRAEIFTNLFQHIKLFTDYINITFDKEKMYIQTMDSGRVSIFEIYLPKAWFDIYEFNSDENVVMGINANVLFKVLNTRHKQQEVNIVYQEGSDKLNIHFTNDDKSIFDKHFELPLMEIDTELLQIPNFESDVDISIPSTTFAAIISQLQIFGDTIEFKCTEEKIQLFSISSESGKMIVDIEIDDLTAYSITEDNEMNISFSLAKIHNICQYNKMAKEIEILLTNDYPMQITYDLGIEDAKMVFYLAPKIGDE
jgi:proliferating cell nuclear antigen PCNA